VAVVLEAAPPWSIGGRERRYAELLSRWERTDLDVTVYTMRWWDQRPEGAIRYRALTPKLALYTKGRRSIFQAVVFSLGTFQLLFRRFDEIQADHMPYLQLFPLRLIAWIRRVPLIVDWHEYWGRAYWQAYLGKAGVAAAALESLSLRLPDVIVADSVALSERLRALGIDATRVYVVSNAVDRSRGQGITAAGDTPDVLFVGRLLEHKRCDLAIEALAKLPRDVRLGIIGTGPEADAIAALARRLGVDGRVTFYGSIDGHDEVWSLVRGARVLVSPSEREGFGIAVAEALAVGTPVVTVDDLGNEARRLVEDGTTGSIVATGDPAALAHAIATWLEAPQDRDAIRSAFWSRHPELDWDVSAERYRSLLIERAR
jgi:glycosyltransferase involved in cell wall biosynthesis